eukprot:SAG31_NODE_307_length_17957_cov_5.236645_20_plen_74_part_00
MKEAILSEPRTRYDHNMFVAGANLRHSCLANAWSLARPSLSASSRCALPSSVLVRSSSEVAVGPGAAPSRYCR